MVAVADEHGVEVREQLGQDRLDLAADRAQALPQHGVHEDPQVVHLDQDGGMAEERQAGVLRSGGPGGRGCPHGAPGVVAGGVAVDRHAPMVP